MAEVVTLGEAMALFVPSGAGPLRHQRSFELRMAGAESNFAIALTRLGITCRLVSRVGDDAFGRFLLQQLRAEGVDVSRITTDPEAPTGLYVKEFPALGATRAYYYRRGSAASRLGAEAVERAGLETARWLHLTGITPALSPSCSAAVSHGMDLARAAGVRISFDPNLRVKLWNNLAEARAALLPLMRACDVLLAGDEETVLLLEVDSAEEALERALGWGVPVVVIKTGADGALVGQADERWRAPAFPVERVVDPVGAGDGFDAGFVYGLLEGWDLERAARLGNAVAAHALAVSGDYEAYPTRTEAEALLAGRRAVER